MEKPTEDRKLYANIRGALAEYLIKQSHYREMIPQLPGTKGRQYYCRDSSGQWHYLNHAREWMPCPKPIGPC